MKINYRGVELNVEYDYQPYEPMEPNYPGCEEYVEVTKVLSKSGDDITELFDDFYDLEEKLLDLIKRDIKGEIADNAWTARHDA